MDIIEKVYSFYDNFKGEKGFIGKTYQHRKIPFFVVEKTKRPRVIVQYSIHAREYITSYLALKQIEDFIKDGKSGKVYFIPMVNIDGVRLCLDKYPLFKSNYNLVDLNLNFDANFGSGKTNKGYISFDNFTGAYPFDQKESKVLKNFTLKIKPDVTISYHSKGEEIYFDFGQDKKRFRRDKVYAEEVSKATNYKVVMGLNSSGGYKDWCVKALKIPSLTIEVGKDSLSHPILEENLDDIYVKNKDVIKKVIEVYDRQG